MKVWTTEPPSWAGDCPAYRAECDRCGWTSGELYSVRDALDLECFACAVAEDGRRNRRWLDGATLVTVTNSEQQEAA